MNSTLTFATRPSALARWQTGYIIEQLRERWPDLYCDEVVITTQGDRDLDTTLPEIGGKGLFTYELEQALRAGRVHAAVHSLKDLPTEDTPGLRLGAIPSRADIRDVLICPAKLTLDKLPVGAVVGTSSNRRQAQLLAFRPDLQVKPIRGNIDTRIRKVLEGQYDAIILAAAGVTRLGLEKHIAEYLPFEIMLPAPGQGALAVQCRANDRQTQVLLKAIDHEHTRLAVSAERAFLSALGGGCSLPVGAMAEVQGEEIMLRGVIAAPDGSHTISLSASGNDPVLLGQELAHKALEQGARAYIPPDSIEELK
ncbi:MAG TPA: hydroxymethylbilane synthase [Anaerolineales bacterium]|nr:hydroxymethylbilane synthase [Anaerolineales bacterium]